MVSPEEYTIWFFWEMTSRIISVSSTLWFDSGTCCCQVMRLSWSISHFYLKRWITDLEVVSRLSELLVFRALLGSTVALEMTGGESFSPDDAYDSACTVSSW